MQSPTDREKNTVMTFEEGVVGTYCNISSNSKGHNQVNKSIYTAVYENCHTIKDAEE